jgi:hypothetical protein
VNNHLAWGKEALSSGFSGIYEREFYPRYGTLPPNYPPIPLFLFAGFYLLYEWVYRFAWEINLSFPLFPSNLIFFLQDQDTLPAFLKIPAIFADIGIAFNFLLFSDKFLWSSMFFTLAVLSKQTSALFVPVFIVCFLREFGFRNSLRGFFLSVVIFWLMFLPFYKSGNIFLYPFTTYWNRIQTASVSDFITYHAFNFWVLVAGLGQTSDLLPFVLGIPFQIWGYILFAILSVTVLSAIYKCNNNVQIILLSATLVSLGGFMFLTRIHERHLEMALPFLLLFGLTNKRILPVFFYLSVFHFLNLYHNWWAPRFEFLVEALSSVTIIKTLTAIAVGVFLFLLLKLLLFLRYSRL